MLHELSVHSEGQDFCLAGPRGDEQRALMPPDARLVWTVEATSHFEAMTLYYEHMDWGEYTTDLPEYDRRTYADWGWTSDDA